MLDAIVCDPPYGVRAGARQSGHEDTYASEHTMNMRTMHYAPNDVMADLLRFAALALRMQGRLVYLLPSTQGFDEELHLPRHPCLKVVACSAQHSHGPFRRRLVTMVKCRQFEQDMEAAVPMMPGFAKKKQCKKNAKCH